MIGARLRAIGDPLDGGRRDAGPEGAAIGGIGRLPPQAVMASRRRDEALRELLDRLVIAKRRGIFRLGLHIVGACTDRGKLVAADRAVGDLLPAGVEVESPMIVALA